MNKGKIRMIFAFLTTTLIILFLPLQVLAQNHGLIAFIKYEGDPIIGGNTELWVANPDGTGQRRLIPDQIFPLYPSWSKDGTHLGFTAFASNTQSWEVHTVNALGTQRTQVTRQGGRTTDPDGITIWIDLMKRPSINYNGTKILYTAQSQTLPPAAAHQNDPHLWVIAADGGGTGKGTELTDVQNINCAFSGQADFCPLDDRIAFAGFDGRGFSHYGTLANLVIHIRGASGGITYLSNPYYGYDYYNSDWQGTPEWSPSGQKICFINQLNQGLSGYGLSVINADGTGQQMIYGPTPNAIEHATWIDDNTIAFNISEASWSTYLIDVNTKVANKINGVPTDWTYPAWGLAVPPPSPVISSITPNSAYNNQIVDITNLSGSNFQTGATVKLTKSGQSDICATDVCVPSASKITCKLDLNGQATGTWNVAVTNEDTQSATLDNGFTILDASVTSPPTISSITPDYGYNNQTANITNLSGSNFQTGAIVKLTKSGQSDICATDVCVPSSSKITCKLDLRGKATGVWNVVVTNLDKKSATLNNGFTIFQYSQTPDSQKPAGTILINNGAGVTTSNDVTLSLNAQDNVGVTQMIISNSASFSGGCWEAYKTTKAWTLTSGTGDKTVYAKFKDAAGNESDVCYASIKVATEKSSERLYGETRYETAVKISQEGWPGGASDIILARGDMFPDALSGAPLAAKYNAPILLTSPQSLTKSTAEEIKRLKATNVKILGSEDAVYPKVVEDLQNQCGISSGNIARFGGETRYDTAGEIAKQLSPPTNKTAIIAYGENYPDALASASVAAAQGMPILIVKLDAVPAATQEALKSLKIENTIIVGGPDVVSSGVQKWLDDNGYHPTRLGGETRYETCDLIADYILKNMSMSASCLGVAFGENFPDALTLGPLAGKFRSPVLLVRDTFIPDKIKEFITTHKNEVYQVYMGGGPDVVSDGVANEIKTIIGAK